ncbi:Regulatory protein leu3 [Exophiala sideris]|uniref:Regulatory protein leu3 n=1 Tax=Exophiala sideris TaxID=1016849 RepID=A0ABR0JFV6_9EURO|nr:Regulatory protein leu3 [Exophiala sideris]KAK5063532.1 Regulatory protein leu3 [Exophiala sideris]
MRLDCTVDPSYRRANRYDKVRDLQRQLELLQSTGEYQQCDTPPAPTVPVPPRSQPTHQSDEHEPDGQVTTAPVDVVSTVAAVVAEDRSTILPITSTQQGFTLETDLVKPTAGDDHATSTRTAAEASDCSSSNGMNSSVCVLGVIRLPRVQAKAMFATYFEKYHPFLPILDSQRTNESCYETSPLLFWSIIGVAARQLQLEDNFLKQLGSELSQALWTTVASNTPSTQHVQAMLLLASWPLPDVRLWTDKSLTFTKMAMNLAMMMGMHRPGCEHEYSKDSAQASNNWDTLERSRTWIAAAALCQSLSLDLGHGSVSNFDDWSIRDVCCMGTSFSAEIPLQIRHNLMIQRCSFEALRSLTQAADGPYGIPAGLNCFDLIDRCEQQFRDLESSLNDQLSLANRLELQGSKLHIQCFYFLYDDRVELRLPGILRAYATASTLISTILSDDSSHDVLPHAPLRFTRIILNAALVIFRILHSTFAFGLDHSHGKLLFNAAAFAMQQQSVPQKDRDFPLRGSDMLRAFWRAGERSTTMFNQDLKLRVKSRMGASLVYDCLLLFRQKDRSANLSQDSTTNGAQTSPHDLNLTVAPSENVYTQPMHVPNSAPSVSGSIFSEGLLHISPNIDMSNMFWLEDMGYPGFFDIG